MGANISKRGSYSFTSKSKKKKLEKTVSLISISSREIYDDLLENSVEKREVKLNGNANIANSSEDWENERIEDYVQHQFAQHINPDQKMEDNFEVSNTEEQISEKNWKDVLNNGFWKGSTELSVDQDFETGSSIQEEQFSSNSQSLINCNEDKTESVRKSSVTSSSSDVDTEIEPEDEILCAASDNSADDVEEFYDAEEFYDFEDEDSRNCGKAVTKENGNVKMLDLNLASDGSQMQEGNDGKALNEFELETPFTVHSSTLNEESVKAIEETTSAVKSKNSSRSGSSMSNTEEEEFEDHVIVPAEIEENSEGENKAPGEDCFTDEENSTASELKTIMTSISKLRFQIESEEDENNNMYQLLIKIMMNVNSVKNEHFDEHILKLQSRALNEITDCLKILKLKKFHL